MEKGLLHLDYLTFLLVKANWTVHDQQWKSRIGLIKLPFVRQASAILTSFSLFNSLRISGFTWLCFRHGGQKTITILMKENSKRNLVPIHPGETCELLSQIKSNTRVMFKIRIFKHLRRQVGLTLTIVNSSISTLFEISLHWKFSIIYYINK